MKNPFESVDVDLSDLEGDKNVDPAMTEEGIRKGMHGGIPVYPGVDIAKATPDQQGEKWPDAEEALAWFLDKKGSDAAKRLYGGDPELRQALKNRLITGLGKLMADKQVLNWWELEDRGANEALLHDLIKRASKETLDESEAQDLRRRFGKAG